jgi:hypothetical protein
VRIAVSGSAGIGKTTLAVALAEALGLPLIAENYEPLFRVLGKVPPTQPVLAAALTEIHETKRALEARHGDFVTDRCPVDVFYSWLMRGLGTMRKETAALFAQCREQTRQYDLVVLPPWGAFEPPKPPPGPGVRRAVNPWIQLRGHACVVGLATMWVGESRLVRLPVSADTVERRVEHVRAVLARNQRRMAQRARPS